MNCPLTDVVVLAKDERRHQVSPNCGRLEDEEEDPKVVVDHIRTLLVLLGSLRVPRDGQVGAFSRPQRRTTQTQDDRGWDEGVPVRQIRLHVEIKMSGTF